MTIKRGQLLRTQLFADHAIDRYRKDQIIFSQDDPASDIFFIQTGKVKVTVVSKQGKEAVIAILGNNDLFGEGCLAGQPRRMATATAMAEVIAVRLRRPLLFARSKWRRHSPRCSLSTY